jgi:NDP-sugar pyrophosphorylase family protein
MASVLNLHADAKLVVALRRVSDASRYGAAVVNGGRVEGFSARGTCGPGLINAGSYLVARDLPDMYSFPAKFSWEHDFLEARATDVRPVAFECDVPFIDIGIPEALAEAQTLIPAWAGDPATARVK